MPIWSSDHIKWINDDIVYLRTHENKRKVFLKNFSDKNEKNFKKIRKIMDRTKNVTEKDYEIERL
jgi:hypothetical protein